MDLSALVGLGGLGVAALSLWIAYKERTKWYRERLHDRQLDACLAVFKGAHEAWLGLYPIGWLRLHPEQAKDPGAVQDPEETRLIVKSAEDLMGEWGLILPSQVMHAFGNFCEAAEEVWLEDEAKQESLDELTRKFFELGDTMRDAMGVDPLTKDTQALIRRPPR